jgi:hypothetical protein
MRSYHAFRAAIVTTASLFAATLPSQVPVVRVGPDVLMSRTPDVAQAELRIGAHPTDPKRLIATGIAFRSTNDLSTIIEAYLSTDGGHTWTTRVTPHQEQFGGGDPHAGYTNKGTALNLSISRAGGIWVYRSEDDGLTWDGRRAAQGDYEQLAFDRSSGKYGGRIYIAAEGASANHARTVDIWRSSDDGRTWEGPATVPGAPPGGLTVAALDVLSDGTVAVWIGNYPMQDTTIPNWQMLVATSTDGGATFSAPILAHTYFVPGGWPAHRRRIGQKKIAFTSGHLEAAVDSKSEKFRDRMYMTWLDFKDERAQGKLFSSYSTDHGKTWSKPKRIAPNLPDSVTQSKQAMAVNKDGTVGVMWLDNSETDLESWHVYFAASIDGGETWSKAARVSTEKSTPFGPGNAKPLVSPSRPSAATVSISLYPAMRWIQGGDYLGMAADADGVFHPFWADARTGTYQVHTSRIEVSKSAPSLPAASALEQKTVNESVKFLADPVSVDWERGEVHIPLRVRNMSADTLFGPLVVRVKSLGDTTAMLLTATNGITKAPGAELDYTVAMRDFKFLPPGGVTDAIVWKVKPKDMRFMPGSISTDILASVKKAR